MRCFVIMPFDAAFDDVHTMIKTTVLSVDHSPTIECFRLDEARPAGRITNRLLDALRESSFCVADLTGCKPNVMWETGYAMALGRPLIVVTQDLATLPFDVKDMQALAYDRSQLSKTLGAPLRDVVRDTLMAGLGTNGSVGNAAEDNARLVVGLGVQLAELKEMVGQIVGNWSEKRPPRHRSVGLSVRLRQLEGSWFNETSQSNLYAKIVNDTVVAPYCYSGNHELTAYYYDWREMGEYLFARFTWIGRKVSGFTFLKPSAKDTLQGAWWYDDQVSQLPERPPAGAGNSVVWHRTRVSVPNWAKNFFNQVRDGQISDFPS